MHGGDIYRNDIKLDFSVNINPLGVPSQVQWALTEAVLHAERYPDIHNEKLIFETAKIFDTSEDNILYGNGASEIIMAICHALQPKTAMLISPCFLGYEYGILGASPECNIFYYRLYEKNEFRISEEILEVISNDKPSLLFLANPNNPNGLLIDKALLKKIIDLCQMQGTMVVLDECFITLTGKEKEYSLASKTSYYESLIVLRAFTKTFGIPGVRLGYAICSNKALADKIKSHLPEWNISIFAQMAGVECLKQMNYLEQSIKVINKERKYLTEALSSLGFTLFESNANYILFKAKIKDLREKLIDYNILIRDCCDYDSLEKGFYRISIKSHSENEILINTLEKILNE